LRKSEVVTKEVESAKMKGKEVWVAQKGMEGGVEGKEGEKVLC